MTDKLNSDIVVAKLFGEMNSTSLELSFKSHFVCLYMYVCNHVRMLIVQINMFKPIKVNTLVCCENFMSMETFT